MLRYGARFHIPFVPCSAAERNGHKYATMPSDDDESMFESGAFDDTNPDDYLDVYFYSNAYDESICMSCIHWNGSVCDSDYGRCEHEHY